MFVRWRLYRTQASEDRLHKSREMDARLSAILVESLRVGGQPRHKYIKYLGSVRLDGRDRDRFWYDVTTTLNGLASQFSPAERKQIEASINKRVTGKLLTKAQLRQADRRRAEVLATLGKRLSTRRN